MEFITNKPAIKIEGDRCLFNPATKEESLIQRSLAPNFATNRTVINLQDIAIPQGGTVEKCAHIVMDQLGIEAKALTTLYEHLGNGDAAAGKTQFEQLVGEGKITIERVGQRVDRETNATVGKFYIMINNIQDSG